jgi:hypothetical protein
MKCEHCQSADCETHFQSCNLLYLEDSFSSLQSRIHQISLLNNGIYKSLHLALRRRVPLEEIKKQLDELHNILY